MLKKKKTIGVVFGGRSTEHEISLRSAAFILQNIPAKYNILPIGIRKDGSWITTSNSNYSNKDFKKVTNHDLDAFIKGKNNSFCLKTQIREALFLPAPLAALTKKKDKNKIINFEVDCIFPVLHGTNGEDGRIQGLFELAEFPFVGAGMRTSVIGIDKDYQKCLVKEQGIRVARFLGIERYDWLNKKSAILEEISEKISYPCFIKPNSLGSAVGTGPVSSPKELTDRINDAFCYDTRVLVEEILKGGEFECAFTGHFTEGLISHPGEIAPSGFYSYEEKYSSDSTSQVFMPARLSQDKMNEIISIAKKVAKALRLDGFCRIDFFRDVERDEFVFNEINTIPGMTSISMFPKALEYEKIAHKVWIDEAIRQAMERVRLNKKMKFSI